MNFDYSLIDIFGIAISLRYLQKDQYQTKFGALVTIIIGACIVIQSVLVGKELFLKENPQVIFSERFVASPQRFTMRKDNFNFAIGIQHPGNYTQFIDESIYTLSAKLTTMKKIYNTTTQAYEQVWDSQTIPAAPCTSDNFGVEATIDYFKTLPGSDQLFCLDQQSMDIYVEGNFDQDQYAYVQLVFSMCSGNVKCRPPEEIVEALTNSFVAIYMNDIIINPKQIDPFTYVGRDFFWNISPVFPKDAYLYFRNIYIESDKGVFFEEKSYDHKTSYSMQTESIIFAENTYLFSMTLRLEKAKESVYNRTYQKLSDVLAQIGGIAKALIMIGFGICMPINQLSLNQQISNSLFSFKESKTELVLKNGKTLTPGQQFTQMIELGKQKIIKSNQQISQRQHPNPRKNHFSGQTEVSPISWQINNTDGLALKKGSSNNNVECGQEEDQKIELIEFDQISEKDIYTTQNIMSNENCTKPIENKLKTTHQQDHQRSQQLSDYYHNNPYNITVNNNISLNIKPGNQLNVSNNTEQNDQASSPSPPVPSQKSGEYQQNQEEYQYPNEDNLVDLLKIQLKEKEEVKLRPAQLFAQKNTNIDGIIQYENQNNSSQKDISNENNDSEQARKQARELSSRRASRRQSTKIVKSIFHDAESSDDILNLKWSDYLKYYIWPFGTFQSTKKKIDFSVDKIYQHLDMLFIIKKLSELERLKTILLDDDQVKLLQFLPKPQINLEEIEKNLNKQKKISKSPSSASAYPHQTNSFLDDKDLNQSDKDKAKDAFQALKNIIKKPTLTAIDKKIMEMLDPTILDNIQNNQQYIRELDSVENEEDLINGGQIQRDPYFKSQFDEEKISSGGDQEKNGKEQEDQLQKQQLKYEEKKQIEILTENSCIENNQDIVIEITRSKKNSIENHYHDPSKEKNLSPKEQHEQQEQQIQLQQTEKADEKIKQSNSNNVNYEKHNNLQPESQNCLFLLSSQRQPLSQANAVSERQSEASQPIIPNS